MSNDNSQEFVRSNEHVPGHGNWAQRVEKGIVPFASSYLLSEWEKELGFLSCSPKSNSQGIPVQTNKSCAQQGCLGGSGMVCGIYSKGK